MTEDKTEGRRKALTMGALASGALAFGASGSASTQQQAASALVFTYDYDPRRPFEEVSRLQQTTTNQILGDAVDQPDEWTGFVARYQEDEEDPGEFFLAFTRGGNLGEGTFGTDATFFAAESNLLVVSIMEEEVAETTPEEETTPTPEEETPTPEDEETPTPEEEETPTPEDEETPTPEGTPTPEDVVVGNETNESDGG